MSFTLTGTLKAVMDTQKVSDRFTKREFVVTDDSGMYPQDILFQLTQDRVNMIDPFKDGDRLKVSFNLRGREWTGKDGQVRYFNSLEAWRLENDEAAAKQPSSPPPADDLEPTGPDDLPF